jgi:hypothetical protein
VTAEQIVENAIAEVRSLGVLYHAGSRIPMYRRITVRQQELFSLAGSWNEDYVGWSATGQMSGGVTDLRDLRRDDHPTVPGIERITRIEISDPGTSSWAIGTEVNVVPRRDAIDSAEPPRATLRSAILEGVGTDLNGVLEVECFYVRIPRPLEDANDEPEIVGGHADLLVVDLARWMILSSGDEDLAKIAAPAVEQLNTHEQELISAFESHVKGFAPTQSRFGS